VAVAPVRLGMRPLGSVGLVGQLPSEQTIRAIVNLAAITIEKARALEDASRAEATRQSEVLKSALLDSLAHDIKTPLTSIKAAVTALLGASAPADLELLTIIDEEADRLNNLAAEVIAMATDLAEFVGAAIALNILFGVPLFAAGVLTAIASFGILALQRRGHRRFEVAIAFFLAIILLGFLYDTLRIGFDAGAAAKGFVPSFDGSDSVLLAAGILGATVMPHVIYLHSALTQDRVRPRGDEEKRTLLRFQRVDVTIAMTLAGLVNMSMLLIAASLFHGSPLQSLDTIQGAYDGFKSLVGPQAATAFGLALLASGFASSSVGTYAGQVVMQGFIARTIPLALRRAITMAPALLVLAIGVNPSRALVISQVILSFGIPFALVPLVILTRRRDVMGVLVNARRTTIAAAIVAAAIIALNVFLIVQTLFG